MNQEKFENMYGNVIWTGKPCSFFGLPWNFTRYILTDKKLIIRTGFLNIKEEKIELYRIVDTSMNHPITQRIFGCGTINLMSKDVSCPNVSLKEVKNPYMVHKLFEDAIESQKKEYNVLGKDIYGVSSDFDEDHICNN